MGQPTGHVPDHLA